MPLLPPSRGCSRNLVRELWRPTVNKIRRAAALSFTFCLTLFLFEPGIFKEGRGGGEEKVLFFFLNHSNVTFLLHENSKKRWHFFYAPREKAPILQNFNQLFESQKISSEKIRVCLSSYVTLNTK